MIFVFRILVPTTVTKYTITTVTKYTINARMPQTVKCVVGLSFVLGLRVKFFLHKTLFHRSRLSMARVFTTNI